MKRENRESKKDHWDIYLIEERVQLENLYRWWQVMIDEMHAFEHSSTWEFVPLSPSKKSVGCRWVCAIKVGPLGEVDSLKAHLVTKGYT